MSDVLGMVLERAESLLRSREQTWEVRETSPPGNREILGPKRVIRQQWSGDHVILTVCRVPDAFQRGK